MIYFIASALLATSEETKKKKATKNKDVKNGSDYIYTDYKAKIREAERKKHKS